MTIEPSLLTGQDLTTITGAVGIVVIGTNSLCYTFALDPRKVGLILSLVVAYTALGFRASIDPIDWVLAALNSMIIFASATGVTAASRIAPANHIPRSNGAIEETTRDKREFWTPWFG
jgi:hypothetical protein